MFKNTGFLLIIIAGFMNGSFVIPSKYIKNLRNESIWLIHGVVGLIIIPWLILYLMSTMTLNNYLTMDRNNLFLIILGGLIFGVGQICFATAIEYIGIALSFVINIGIGVALGSIFAACYRHLLFSQVGLYVIGAVLFIIVSLIISYFSKPDHNSRQFTHSSHFKLGCILATATGITSGFQNVVFIILLAAYPKLSSGSNSFWIWPPFLMMAGIAMAIGFYLKAKKNSFVYQSSSLRKNIMSNLILISIMGLFFSGSLALYSVGMGQMTGHEQLIGWPAFMMAIILTTQFWGAIFNEIKGVTRKKIYLKLISILLLLVAIIILSIKKF